MEPAPPLKTASTKAPSAPVDVLLAQLNQHQSWRLDRISPSTYAPDAKIPPAQALLIREGKCYRCRIGRGAWWYGESISKCIRQALHEMEKEATNA